MEPLVIIAIVVLFSVLDAMARKQRQGGETGTSPDAGDAQPLPGEPASFDGEAEGEAGPRSTTLTASEELLPADLWEEIRQLARGSAPAQTVPAPRPRRPRPARGARRPKPRAPVTPAPAEEHPVHRSHAQMGRPLAERRLPLERPKQGPRASADVLAVRAMLTDGGPSALRRAVILEEVLGPPAAMRGDPYEPEG